MLTVLAHMTKSKKVAMQRRVRGMNGRYPVVACTAEASLKAHSKSIENSLDSSEDLRSKHAVPGPQLLKMF